MSATWPALHLVCRFVGCVSDDRGAGHVAIVPRQDHRSRGVRSSMQVSTSRLAALVAAVVLAAVALVGSAHAANAVTTPTVEGQTCQKPPQSAGDSIHMIGCLTDNRDKPPSPVPDVAVTVEDESGEVVGEDTSDAQGVFDVTLPGTAVDNLGESYTIKIDTETLPEGTSLVDEKKTSLSTRI